VGALAAYVRVKRAGFRPSLNLLYALEGAILDCHWQDIPEARRAELIADAESAGRAAAAAEGQAHAGGRAGHHHATRERSAEAGEPSFRLRRSRRRGR
jgi:hypothetical protein